MCVMTMFIFHLRPFMHTQQRVNTLCAALEAQLLGTELEVLEEEGKRWRDIPLC